MSANHSAEGGSVIRALPCERLEHVSQADPHAPNTATRHTPSRPSCPRAERCIASPIHGSRLKSYDFQRREAYGSADQLGVLYGRRPVLFRPPFGDEDPTTLRVVHDCGMKAAFFWKETVNNGVVRYQSGHKVQRGDIILMHFRPAFVADFLAALQAIHDAGLTPALLTNYVA